MIFRINKYILVTAAVLLMYGNMYGCTVFLLSSIIGVTESVRTKNRDSLMVNLTFLAMNGYFTLNLLRQIRWV